MAINKKPASCAGCPLEHCGVGFVPPEINTVGGVMLVGEAPGIHAAQSSRLFEGNAGKHLKWLLSLKGMRREEFSLATILACSPPDKVIPPGAIYHCSKNLDAAIDKAKPKVIVALGTTALKTLTGVDGGVDRLRGFILNSFRGVPVVGTYHPSYLQPRKGEGSTSHHIPLVVRDLLLAKEIAAGTYTPVPFTIWEDPSPMEVDQFIREYEHALTLNPDLALACDIETPYKLKAGDEENYVEVDTTITRVSFGYEAGRAISIPWSGAWMPQIKRLFGSAGRKWWWNGWTFDVPIIEDAGVTVAGRQEDMMWAFHLLQPDLRYGLEKVASIYCPDLPPWKHENSSRPAYYSGMDSVALWRIGEGVERELRKCGMWELYQKHRVKVSPVLREAGRNGIRIDARARRALYKKLRREEKRLLADIQPLVPPSLYPRKRYKKFPTIWEDRRSIEHVKVSGEIKVCGNCGTPVSTAAQHVGKKGGKKGIPLNPCYKAKVAKQPGMVTHYDVVMDFNPLSVAQLMTYVEYFRHPVGTHRVTKNPTLDDNHLEKLVAKYGEKHPIYSLVQELRTVRKTISTYVVGLRPDERGVVTTEYGFRPATGRLSSKGIVTGEDKGTNLQNIPHRDDHPYADDIRKMIIPFEGMVFVEADSSSIEAVMTGHFMGDAEYMALAQKGIHSYVACKSLGLEFTPENVKLVKTKHKSLYDRKKRVNHGCFPGDHEVLTPHGWVALEDFDWVTPIAEWDNGKVAFKFPIGSYIKDVVDEPVKRLTGRSIDVTATMGHKWPILTSQGNIKAYTTETLPKANSIPFTGILEGTATGPAALVAAVQADGTILASGKIQWHLKKQRKIDRLLSLLDGRAFTHTGPHKDGAHMIVADLPDVMAYFHKQKHFNLAKLLNWDVETRLTFLDELPYWDGVRSNSVSGKQTAYLTTVKENAEAVATIAHVTGRSALLREAIRPDRLSLYTVSFNARKALSLESIERVDGRFTGRIYCPITSSGYFLVRHNGKIVASGNTNYGMTKWLMTALYPSLFPTPAVAQREIDELYKLLPKLRDFHHAVRVQASKDRYIVSPWGYRRYFYDVFRYKKDRDGNAILDSKTGLPKIELGEDGKSVIAQLPQNGAAAFMLDNVPGIAEEIKAIGGVLPGNFLVHDSSCICVPPDKVDEAVEILVKYLTRPIPELNNIRIGCEVKVGTDWGPGMKTVKVVEADGTER